jgi:hypothetical protein
VKTPSKLLFLGSAALAPTVFNIGGTDYDVVRGNNLNTNGTLTINSLSVVPEPTTWALLAGSLTALIACRRRRVKLSAFRATSL